MTTFVDFDSATVSRVLLTLFAIDSSILIEAVIVTITLFPMINLSKSLDHGNKVDVAKNHEITKALTKRMWLFAIVNIAMFLSVLVTLYFEFSRVLTKWVDDSIALQNLEKIHTDHLQ